MKKILLINQGKTENLGDKAINIVFQNLLIEHGCIVDFAGFAQTQEQSLDDMKIDTKYNFKSYIKKIIPEILVWFFKYRDRIYREFNEVVKNNCYDLVIIGGGQLIKTKNVFPYTLLSWFKILSKNLSCPIVLAGVGVDPEYSFLERFIYKKLLPKFDAIYVRDKKSKSILLNQFNVKSHYIPDIVFAFSRFYSNNELNIKKDKLLVMIYDYNALKKNFGTEHRTEEEYYQKWIELIKENIESSLDIVLGYTTIGDKKMTISFSEYLKANTNISHRIINTDEIEKLVDILKTTKKVISGRMHGMLLAMNYNCEIIPYLVSPKIEAFNDEWIQNQFNIDSINNEIDKKIEEILRV